MNIFLTYDYELFFGEPTGSVEKCIIDPTNKLLELSKRCGVKYTFFVDVGYLKQLELFKDSHEAVAKEHEQLRKQINQIITEGHDCQLHIHPHWEDSGHDGIKWNMVTDRYKLDDFSDEEIYRIVTEYHRILERWTGKRVHTYRAGGWCLQPFKRIQKIFTELGIKYDSTVFPGGKFAAGNYFYDFTSVPNKSNWKFSEDLCVEDPNGLFKEYPISSYKYSPFFFWRLFFLGRWNPRGHKPSGDGYPMKSPGLRKTMLSRGMQLCASVDGFFVTKLDRIIKKNIALGFKETVIIGHPKACTTYALSKLETFIKSKSGEHQFLTFSDLTDDEAT